MVEIVLLCILYLILYYLSKPCSIEEGTEFDTLIGKSEEEAENHLRLNNLKYRIVRRDNEHVFYKIEDNIVYLELDRGKVTNVNFS